ncbi:hypothetical protein EVV80_28465, partial [Klebsiella pneumoniae]
QGGELYLTGGGAASATWLQIIADCTGRTVVSSAFNELSARGAAILAARSVSQPGRAGRFSALARTPPAPNCSARCLKDWPSPLSMRCRVIRRAASCI